MGRFDIFPIFIATFASRRVTLIATHSKSQKQTRLPIRYLYFNPFLKPLINKEVIAIFQNSANNRSGLSPFAGCGASFKTNITKLYSLKIESACRAAARRTVAEQFDRSKCCPYP